MLYRHKRTSAVYRKLFESFSVERQKHSVVYVAMLGGPIFDRDAEAFAENFEVVGDPQADIVPKAPHS